VRRHGATEKLSAPTAGGRGPPDEGLRGDESRADLVGAGELDRLFTEIMIGAS